MITIEQMKKLDPSLLGIPDRELEELRTSLYEMGRLAFDIWSERKAVPTSPSVIPLTSK